MGHSRRRGCVGDPTTLHLGSVVNGAQDRAPSRGNRALGLLYDRSESPVGMLRTAKGASARLTAEALGRVRSWLSIVRSRETVHGAVGQRMAGPVVGSKADLCVFLFGLGAGLQTGQRRKHVS